jgi:putative transcription antitermination factor YqgF
MTPPEEKAPLPRGRVAGVDYGRKRIGVAVCDAERIIASPLCVRETSGDHAADAAFFQQLVRTEDLVGFVVGLPLHADGTSSGMAREAERFGGWLGRSTGLPVVFQDERYTSHEAASLLAGAGFSRDQKKRRSDAIAAQLVLQGWMAAHPHPDPGFPAPDPGVAAAGGGEAGGKLRLIVGCGELGLRVARRWLSRGDRVVGITRSEARAETLAAAGIEPAVLDVTAADPGWTALLAAIGRPATVLWSVGFDRSGTASYHDVHVAGLGRLLDALASHAAPGPPPRVVFASSTGVWGDEQGGIVTEATPAAPSREAGRILVEAEQLLAAHPAGPGTALRFAGLYGPGRLPRLADLRAGRPIAADPDSWLNLVHLDDAAAVVEAVADADAPRGLYVVSDGRPVRRREWYVRLAELAGGPPPAWDRSAPRSRGGDKRVDPGAVLADLGLRLAYPDALAALPALVAEG